MDKLMVETFNKEQKSKIWFGSQDYKKWH